MADKSSITGTLARALTARDKAADICPVNLPNWKGGRLKPCPLCGVTGREACPKIAGADHVLMEVVRSIVSKEEAGRADPA